MSHYYKPLQDGRVEPYFRIPTANGKKLRDVTVKDAKEAGALPSPNTIMGVLAKPGLTRWSDRLLIEAVISTPQSMLDDEPAFFNAALETHRKMKEEAANLGTAIHSEIEDAIKKIQGGAKSIQTNLYEWPNQVAAAIDWLYDQRTEDDDIEVTGVEEYFVNEELGFGGMIDVVGWTGEQKVQPVIVDWKTVDMKKVKGGWEWKSFYPEDKLPLIAAYAMGYWGTLYVDAWNVFIARKPIGARLKAVLYTYDELAWGWEKFQHCYELWVMEKKWDPREVK